jgi:hypothetical protein
MVAVSGMPFGFKATTVIFHSAIITIIAFGI